MKEGDRVTYHGSMPQYHDIPFTIAELFEFQGIPCAKLHGPKLDTWIKRCRVSNLKPISETRSTNGLVDRALSWD